MTGLDEIANEANTESIENTISINSICSTTDQNKEMRLPFLSLRVWVFLVLRKNE